MTMDLIKFLTIKQL